MRRLFLLGISSVVTLSVLECSLRWTEPVPRFEVTSQEDLFWRNDPVVGWSRFPDCSGTFSNGFFRGVVRCDSEGNRLNGALDTRVEDWPNLFFIGDSTTASLEVDGEYTVPALIEQELRRRGQRVNLMNLGVRGYGTDQAVRRALAMAHHRPVEVVYMFSENDIHDNNTLRSPYRRYGKGVYLEASRGFVPYNYPVPLYPDDYFGSVLLDPAGQPHLHEGRLPPAPSDDRALAASFDRRLASVSALWRRIAAARDTRWPSDPIGQAMRRYRGGDTDPWTLRDSMSLEVPVATFQGLVDGGSLRRRHAEYYQRQLAFLLLRLRSISSVQRVWLVEFPSPNTLRLLEKGDPSTNLETFAALERSGVVDGAVSLTRALFSTRARLEELECPGDGHFCEEGNRWIASTVLEELELGTTPRGPLTDDAAP